MTKQDTLSKNKRTTGRKTGRPRTVNTYDNRVISLVIGPMIAQVDEYMQNFGCATRAEAIRDLIRRGLDNVQMALCYKSASLED